MKFKFLSVLIFLKFNIFSENIYRWDLTCDETIKKGG